ncbi:tumor suppressor, Mitostatin-domain-containing protein [Cladochytrium replicatum]|nr:tumor suppressor, Mitostatin-domain-containing protein [Cladochytrium replicatum]
MPSDYLITNRRRDEESRNRQREQTLYYAKTTLQSQFEETSDQAILRGHIDRKFNEYKEIEARNLDERREKLTQLLDHEEQRYRAELMQMEETNESRVEKMKERMRFLKNKRESERQKVVEDKLLQRFRNDCDELRVVESQTLEKFIASERAGQLRELEVRKAEAHEENKYYDSLWEEDRQKKIAREEADRARQQALNAATMATLEEQLNLLRQQAIEEGRLKEEEAVLIRQNREMQRLDDERNRLRKLHDQKLIRQELDRFNRKKIQQRQKDIQDALDMDLLIVNEFLRLDEAEKESRSRRKEELRREIQAYREHLFQQQQIERERDRETDKLYRDEEEKVWRMRAEKWQKEQRARDKLMQDVLSGRQEQLRFALEQNNIRQEQIRLEKDATERAIEIAHKAEQAELDKRTKVAQRYRHSLIEQVEAHGQQKRREKQHEELELLAEKDSERRYLELLHQETERAAELPRVRKFYESTKAAHQAAFLVDPLARADDRRKARAS